MGEYPEKSKVVYFRRQHHGTSVICHLLRFRKSVIDLSGFLIKFCIFSMSNPLHSYIHDDQLSWEIPVSTKTGKVLGKLGQVGHPRCR